MDRELSDELTGRMPIVPHSTAGGDCCGCIIAAVDGSNVELQCNDCRAVVGVIQINILRDLLGLESAAATCAHCGKENTFSGLADTSRTCALSAGKPCGHPARMDQIWIGSRSVTIPAPGTSSMMAETL